MKIVNSQIVKRTKPLNLIKNHNHLFENEYEKFFQSKTLNKNKNVFIFSNGLTFKKRLLLEFYINPPITFKTKFKYLLKIFFKLFSIRTFSILERGLIITDATSSGFFHWFGDTLQKLEALENSKIDLSSFTLLIPSKVLNSYSSFTLKKYNFNYRILKSIDLVFIRDVIFVPEISQSGNFRPHLAKKISERFRFKIENKNLNRFYVSRSKAEKRKLINENILYPILKKNKFSIISTEDIVFTEQLKIFSNCEILISIHGAALTNMLWMPDKSKVMEIRLKDDSLNNCYFTLASDLGHDYYYFLAEPTNSKSTQLTDFRVDFKKFELSLNQILK